VIIDSSALPVVLLGDPGIEGSRRKPPFVLRWMI
jgi:hypothetical protein